MLTKHIDQDLYKLVKENTVEKIYHRLTERVKTMRKDVAEPLLDSIEKSVNKFQ